LGRPRGSRNKLGEAFIAALTEDFQLHGAEAIAECRTKFPGKYLHVVASLLPKEVDLAIEADIRQEHRVKAFVSDYRSLKVAAEKIAVDKPRQLLEAKTNDSCAERANPGRGFSLISSHHGAREIPGAT
jgi:hypothetical protein